MTVTPQGTRGASAGPAGDWLTPRPFAGVLAVLIIVCFAPVVAGWRTFYYSDYGQFGYPLAFYHRESFWHGEMPLWNPLNNCGIPFLAQWNTMTLYPPSLFYLIFPLPWSLGVFCLGHMFVAGLGMYFLANRWTGNRLAAAVAGTVFAFNGLTWYGLEWPNNMAGLGWMPWVVLATERAWQEGRRRIVLAALAGALQMLSGAPEVILQTWILLVVLWLARFVEGENHRAKLIIRAGGVVVLVAGLAAAQLLPFLDLLAHSQRAGGFGQSTLLPMPLSGWANYLAPLFRTAPNPQGIWVQANQPWVGSYYVGTGTVALALLAGWRARNQRTWLLLGLAGFSLLMALGPHGLLYGWVVRLVPLVGLVRFPIKFVILATFVIPLLAACGLSWLQALPQERAPREGNRLWGLALGLLGLMAGIVGWAWRFPRVGEHLPALAGNTLVRGLFLVMIVLCVIRLGRAAGGKLQRPMQICLVLLLWFDVYTHTAKLSPTVAPAAYQPDVIRQFFKWDDQLRFGASRAMQGRESFWRMLSSVVADPEVDTDSRRLAQFLNFNLLDHVPKFDGFYSLDLKNFSDLFQQVYFGTNPASRLCDFLGISHVTSPSNIVDWVVRGSCRPMVTAGQTPVFADDAETLKAVLGEDFQPQRTVYLPWAAHDQIQVAAPAGAQITASHFAAQRIHLEVQAEAPAMVVVAQAYYHAWRAYVDGRPTPLWRANYAFQALEVPAGAHQVNLVYEDKAFRCGAILSLAALLTCGTVWLRWRRHGAEVQGATSTGRADGPRTRQVAGVRPAGISPARNLRPNPTSLSPR